MASSVMRIPTGRDFGLALETGKTNALLRLYGNDLARLLYPWQHASVVHRFEDFTEITFNGDPWTVTKDAGATTFANTALAGGVTRGITGAGATDGMSLLGPAIYSGAKNAGMEVRFKSDVITAFTAEAGFIDDVTDKTTPAVSDVDTPTFGAGLAEGAVITWETAETIATPALATKSASFTSVSKVMSTPQQDQTVTTGVTMIAATYFRWRVQLAGTNVFGFIFDANDNILSAENISPSPTAGGITAATLLKPWFAFANITASKSVDIDYIRMWCDR